MSAQTPVGVIPASKTVRSTIEVAVLPGTLGNCTADCMRCANLRKGFPQLEFPPAAPESGIVILQANLFAGRNNNQPPVFVRHSIAGDLATLCLRTPTPILREKSSGPHK